MTTKNKPAKRVDVIRVGIIKEGSVLYGNRTATPAGTSYFMYDNFFKWADREQLYLICLNAKCEIQAVHLVSIGSIDTSVVHPREVFKAAILNNAHSILVAHNHPSDNLEPSRADINITKRLKETGDIIGIPLLDHLIVGSDGRYFSLKEEGYL